MRLEVVNDAVLNARAAVEEAAALIPARKNALDNCRTGKFQALFDGYKRVLRAATRGFSEEEQRVHILMADTDMGKIKLVSSEDLVVEAETEVKTFSIAGKDCAPMDLQGWQQHLGISDLEVQYAILRKDCDDEDRWAETYRQFQKKQEQMQQLV